VENAENLGEVNNIKKLRLMVIIIVLQLVTTELG
jgi:hypothetical protein